MFIAHCSICLFSTLYSMCYISFCIRVVIHLLLHATSPSPSVNKDQQKHTDADTHTYADENAADKAGEKADSDRKVLPAIVLPLDYQLDLQPVLEPDFKTKGVVKITLSVQRETNYIILHSNKLEIHTESEGSVCSVVGREGVEYGVQRVEYNPDDETAQLYFDGVFKPHDTLLLTLHFTSLLSDSMAGLYRTKYTHEGKEVYGICSQFEPTDARLCFPCFDEPSLKATFQLTTTVNAGYTAISNTEIEERVLLSGKEGEGDSYRVKFKKTPKMSTYLLALVIMHLDYVEKETKDGVKVRVYTPVSKQEEGHFALDVGVRSLDLMSEYFDIPYPLSKCDMIAVPDFSAGAMENWGAIVYRTTALLIHPIHSSMIARRRVAYVVAHELAHQWFGNLVTMEWWSQLWLNEGFATFMGSYCVAELYPEYEVWDDFVSSDLLRALQMDSMKSTHPIEVAVKKSSEVNEIFDAISYSKGASVIRMVYNWIGADAFKHGLRLYLNSHLYSNTVTEDLWAALSETSGYDVASTMYSWTRLEGFPVVSVSEGEGEGEGEMFMSVELTQKRFLASGEEEEGEGSVYSAPLMVKNAEDNSLVLNTKHMTLKLPCIKGHRVVKLNSEYSSPYRVQYSEQLHTILCSILPTLPPIDRLSILDDTHSLAKAGVLSTVQTLEVMAALSKHEKHHVVVEKIIEICGEVLGIFGEQMMEEKTTPTPSTPSAADTYERLKTLCRDIVYSMWQSVGWGQTQVGVETSERESDSPTVRMLRPIVLSSVLKYECSEEDTKQALELFHSHMRWAGVGVSEGEGEGRAVFPDIKLPVWSHGVKVLGEEGFNLVEKVYKLESTSQEDKVKCLVALASTDKEDLVVRLLNTALEENSVIRKQDLVYLHATLGRSLYARRANWSFIKEHILHYDSMLEGNFLMAHIVENTLSSFACRTMLNDIEQFFKSTKLPQERAIAKGIESVVLRLKWVERDYERVRVWLEGRE